MKSADIVNHLREVLGQTTTRYGTALEIASMDNVAGVITITFTKPHKLRAGQGIVVRGALRKYALASLERDATGMVYGVTELAHDLTSGDIGRPALRLEGTGVSGLDSVNVVGFEVPNRFQFTFDSGVVDSAFLLTGLGYLVDLYGQDFRGVFQVTPIDNLTVEVIGGEGIPDSSIFLGADILAQTEIRVTGAATEERWYDAYTAQTTGDIFLTVILTDQLINRDRSILTDGTNTRTKADAKWIRELQTVDVIATIPATDSLMGSDAKDLACNEVKLDIYKALCGWKPLHEYLGDQNYVLMPVANSTAAYNGAYYAHRYTFEAAFDIPRNAQFEVTDDKAFRDLGFSLRPMSANVTGMVNLDDVP
jgi:hypothetical protein